MVMMEQWEVWEEVTTAEAWRLTGKRPLKGRWVDGNKGAAGRMRIDAVGWRK